MARPIPKGTPILVTFDGPVNGASPLDRATLFCLLAEIPCKIIEAPGTNHTTCSVSCSVSCYNNNAAEYLAIGMGAQVTTSV